MIRLDNVSLLFWLRYKNSEHLSGLDVYDKLETDYPEYVEFRENEALANKLLAVLELDELVRNMEIRLIDFDGPFWVWGLAKSYREMCRILDDLKEQRKKAHEAYEMLRRLTYLDARGALFEIEFQDRRSGLIARGE